MFHYASIISRDLPYETQHLDRIILTMSRAVGLYLEGCRSEFSEVPSQCCISVCMLTAALEASHLKMTTDDHSFDCIRRVLSALK